MIFEEIILIYYVVGGNNFKINVSGFINQVIMKLFLYKISMFRIFLLYFIISELEI